MTQQSGWEHCVLKYTYDLSGSPEWERLDTNMVYDYTEPYCDAVAHPPRDADEGFFARARIAALQRLVDDGRITADEALRLR